MSEENKKDVVETKVDTQEETKAQETATKEEKEEAKVEQSTNSTNASGTSKPTEEAKKVQSSEENARYAKLRRQYEEQKKRIEVLESEKRESITDNALKELGLTREDLKDEENMELANAYVKSLASGAENPKANAYELVYKAKRESAKKAKEEAEAKTKLEQAENAKILEDKNKFVKEFPNVDLGTLLETNSDFRKVFSDVDLAGNVTTYYRIYTQLKGANKKVTEAQKANANPYVSGTSANANAKVSDEDVLKMSDKDYQAWRKSQIHKR